LKLDFRSFGGEFPRVQPQLLPDQAAQTARDLVLNRGALEPLKAPVYVAPLAKGGVKKTIWRYGKQLDSDTQHWFHWLGEADAVYGPVVSDTQERVYYTEKGQPPKVTDATLATTDGFMPSNAYLLGLPAPANKPTINITGTAAGTAQEVLVAYAYVSAWGEEGPLSVASDPATFYPGNTIAISNMSTAPTGAYNVTLKRIYLSQTDSTGNTVFRFLADLAVATASQSYTPDTTLLGEQAPSPSPLQAPSDLFGLMAHPNGFLMGFSGRNLVRSDVFKPYAWPREYKDPLPFDPLGGAIMGQTAVICTEVNTLIATGADPVGMSIADLGGAFPCKSKRSIGVTAAGVIYASSDGLVAVGPSGMMELATRSIFTREQWQAFKPESMHAAVFDNRYYLWFDTGTQQGTLIFDFNGDGVGVTRSATYATAAHSDPRRDELFIAKTDGSLYKWDAGTANTYLWRSKKFVLDRPQNLGAAKITHDAGPVTLRVYADGALTNNVTLTHGQPFRLRGDYRASVYEFEIESNVKVTELLIASTLGEIGA
jgi:hypothetical protein